METFLVSLSEAGSPNEEAPRQDEGLIGQFRARCQKTISPVLCRPKVVRNKRKKKTPPSHVRRSARIGGRFAAGSSVKQQQRTLMLQLGIAREGETIGEEALQAYLDLFSRPLQQEHIAAIVGLFGWQADVLPLGRVADGAAL